MRSARTHEPVETRFWARVAQGEGCWLWTGERNARGYGRFYPRWKAQYYAHRYSWELHNGPIPDGLYVCHRCDNPSCVRPDHLFLGTQRTNIQDALAKGRLARTVDFCENNGARMRGSGNPMATLSEADVRAIRERYKAGGITQSQLAAEYGVSRPHISIVVRRIVWGHLP